LGATKSEYRNAKLETIPKSKIRMTQENPKAHFPRFETFEFWSLVLVSDFVLRISDF